MMYKTTGWTRKAAAGLTAVGVALALGACGGPPAPESGASDGTLTVGVGKIPTTFDPSQNVSRTQTSIYSLTAGMLTVLGPNGKLIDSGLAASVEPVGDKQFIVKLKPDLKFSDGSPLNATDVVASFQHLMADKSGGNYFLYEPIAAVTAGDDLTVNFDLSRPYPSLPFALAEATSQIIPAKTIQAKGPNLYKGDPLPTAGQFQIKSMGTDQITLTANPNYAGTQPATKTLVFKQISDPAARLAQLQAGQINFADELSPKNAAQLTDTVHSRPVSSVNGTVFLSVNNRAASILSDTGIRQAIAVAVDRDQINKIALAGMGKPSRGLFANASQYSRPFLPASADIERARGLLAGTKCANGCTLDLLVQSDKEAYTDIAVVVQQNLKAIGVQVNIEKAEVSAVYKRLVEGDFDLSVQGNYAIADLPDNYLAWLLGPASNDYYGTGYPNPRMNQLISQVATTSGPAKDAAIGEVDAMFQRDLPVIPLVDYFVLSGSRVPSSTFDVDPTFNFRVG